MVSVFCFQRSLPQKETLKNIIELVHFQKQVERKEGLTNKQRTDSLDDMLVESKYSEACSQTDFIMSLILYYYFKY